MADVVEDMAASVRFGLSGDGALLGGAMPTYGVYPAGEGFVAVAAIEPHFIAGLMKELGLTDPGELTAGVLTDFFAGRTADQWTAWGREAGLPVVGFA